MPTKKEILKHRIKSRRRNKRDSFFLNSESEQLSSVSVENQDITSSPKALRVNNQNTPISISKDKALYDKSPTEDSEIANKKYVDDNAGGGDMTGVDLTGGTGISIASETGTTSGDYSATLNFDGDVTAAGNSFVYNTEGPFSYFQSEHASPYWVFCSGGIGLLSNQWRHAFLASASQSTYYQYSPASNAEYSAFTTGANGVTSISTYDDGGTTGHFTLDADGDITLDAATGTINLLDNGSTYTPSASSDIANKGYVDSKARFDIAIPKNEFKPSVLNSWYPPNYNHSMGSSITAADFQDQDLIYAHIYQASATTALTGLMLNFYASSAVSYEVALYDVTLPSDGSAAASTITQIGSDIQLNSGSALTAYRYYRIKQSLSSYSLAADHGVYLIGRYTSGSGKKSLYYSGTLEVE